MNRFHIGKDGSPKKCEARKEPCKLGNHFDSVEQADKYIAQQHKQAGDGLSSVSRKAVAPTPGIMRRKITPEAPRDSRSTAQRVGHRKNPDRDTTKRQVRELSDTRKNKLVVRHREKVMTDYSRSVKTAHTGERAERFRKMTRKLGVGRPVAQFECFKGHEHGAEIHEIRDNGTVYIYNKRTKRLVTAFPYRPQQLRRYYEGAGQKAPHVLVLKGHENVDNGRNDW